MAQAHARLMCRHEVTLQDAIVAVTCVECSMQNTALLGGTNALHTKFPEDPEQEFKTQAELILKRLRLNDLLVKLTSTNSDSNATDGGGGGHDAEPRQDISGEAQTSESTENRFGLRDNVEEDVSSPRIQAFDLDDNTSTAASNAINIAAMTDSNTQDIAAASVSSAQDIENTADSTTSNKDSNTQSIVGIDGSNPLAIPTTNTQDIIIAADSNVEDTAASNDPNPLRIPALNTQDSRKDKTSDQDNNNNVKSTVTNCDKGTPEHNDSLRHASTSSRLNQFAFKKSCNSKNDSTPHLEKSTESVQNNSKEHSRNASNEPNNTTKPLNENKNDSKKSPTLNNDKLMSLFRKPASQKSDQLTIQSSNTLTTQLPNVARINSQPITTSKTSSIFTTDDISDEDLDLEWPGDFLSKISKNNNSTLGDMKNKRASTDAYEPCKKKKKDM